MRDKYLKLLKEVYVGDEKDMEVFEEIMNDEGLGKCKPKFNLKAFIFGWFYLLYKRAVLEAFSVLVISLMIAYLMAYAKIHPLLVLATIIIVNSLLSGFCYYFLYLNKFNRDVDYCGEYNTDIECLKKRVKPKISYVIIAVIVIIALIWPWLFALITGYSLKT
ncbi:DUF2628 domain-containing protein [Caminibacter pacificus]|uniref:DUF2628 domain-containing protein n=1 Tax=Caminibacter pacificus TaxID=1424653 RepID=A0ABX5TKY7_9BACT|nr:DUF2628 domain-containing protein [Caminibacter pacificus]